MGYSAEVIRRASSRLAEARANRESENQRHLRQAYAEQPRLREIDRQLRITMALAAQAAFASGSDFGSAMDKVKEQNLALQRERNEIITTHFEPGFLNDSPICDVCGGSGYVGSSMCRCLLELCRQEQKKELSLLSGGNDQFAQFRLDYYPDRVDPKYGASPRKIMDRNFQTVQHYANFFSPASGNLLFVGGTGLGKTFLSACIARCVADRGYSVVYESASHLFSKLERAKFSPSEENSKEISKFNSCDLLIIDDLGTEMPSQFVTAALYSLVNDRLLDSKPMIVSTNLTIEEISRRYSPQIASRFHGNFQGITFVGDDIRVKKSWG